MTVDELKKKIFDEMDYFGACADDPFFDEVERVDFGAKMSGIWDLIQKLGWADEYMGLA